MEAPALAVAPACITGAVASAPPAPKEEVDALGWSCSSRPQDQAQANQLQAKAVETMRSRPRFEGPKTTRGLPLRESSGSPEAEGNR